MMILNTTDQFNQSKISTGKMANVKKVLHFWAVKEMFCFAITLAAGLTGLEYLSHNIALELLFTASLGCVIEYFAHKRMHNNEIEESIPTWKRYAVATVVSLLTWPIHATMFHHHDHHHVSEEKTDVDQRP